MSEKARGGLFNILGDIGGLTILDAFAGSGALGFEAISRGAKHVTAVDVDKNAINTLKDSAEGLGITQQIKAIRANASGWSDNNSETTFDIVLSAPPYDDLQLQLVQKLTKHVKPGGLYVLDWPGNLKVPELTNMKLLKNKQYGDAQLAFYRRIS
jgi:16S rRNA (guanine966-N2)-methyltransferase